MNEDKVADAAEHYLVGGGIASLAAAVFLIRDGGIPGRNVCIFEQSARFGGSLDGSGGPDTGYLVRGGRMFEENFACTFDLLSTIPSPDCPDRSLKDEIDYFNWEVRSSARCRLVRDGQRNESPHFGLSRRHMFDIGRLVLRSERSLKDRTIGSCFPRDFFDTNFWLMWSTMFAFQPWHSAAEMRRYLRRFVHLFPGFKRLEGILRTPFNQYDSMIEPMVHWLAQQGVRFETGAQILDVEVETSRNERRATALLIERDGETERLELTEHDRVYLTLGSMTESSTVGSNAAPPPEPVENGAWNLWRRLAERDPSFGRPEAFCDDTDRTRWESFTVTLRDPAFFTFMEEFTSNAAGTGGLVTFADSGWLMSIVLFHQPHFRSQPDDVFVFWGYGLRGDRPGDFVKKPLFDCSGDEILYEVAGHLGVEERASDLFRGAKVVPCMMPYITSQFMPRRDGDRPKVIPEGARNFAVMGQFCEMPHDTVFTVEYSVRSAMTAVHSLTGHGHPPPPVRRTDRDPAVLLRAARTLLQSRRDASFDSGQCTRAPGL